MRVTVNVTFTPGTVERLLPLTLSLLRDSDVAVRAISNGCRPEEVELLRASERIDPRISHYALPGGRTVEHGLALNRVFAEFPEPIFAIADSDVLATGAFLADLVDGMPTRGAVFSALPAWLTPRDSVSPPGASFLSGRHRVLADGTVIGGTYLAIYDRSAIEPLIERAPRGFGVHHRFALPPDLRSRLDERGWRFRTFDTCRLINLQLLLQGAVLENRASPALHHLGGFSARSFEGARPALRELASILVRGAGEERRQARIVDGVARRLYSRSRPERGRGARNRRRAAVLRYFSAVIDALAAGTELPRQPPTDSAEVDRAVRAAADALIEVYPAGRNAIERAPVSAALRAPGRAA